LRLDLDDGLKIAHPAAVQAQSARPARTVMLFTKTHQSVAALQSILPVCDHETIFVSLQNGLGNGATIEQITGSERVFHGVTLLPATMVEPGFFRSHGSHQTWLSPVKEQHEALGRPIFDDLHQTGFDVEYSKSAETAIWQKACFNVALNAVCALGLASPGLVERVADLKAAVHALADEAISVAVAENVIIDQGKVHAMIDFACANHTFHKPSMLQDVENGRQTEIAALNGHLVRLAQNHDLNIPLNQLISGLISARQNSGEFWKSAPSH